MGDLIVEESIINFLIEFFAVIFVILGSTAILCGLWNVVNITLPGDQEMMEAIEQSRAWKSQVHQRSLEAFKQVSESSASRPRRRRIPRANHRLSTE